MPNRSESQAAMSQSAAESDREFQWFICTQFWDQRSADSLPLPLSPALSPSLRLSDSSVQPQSGRLLCQLWQCSLPASTLWIGVNRLWPRQRPARPDCYNGISVWVCACMCVCCDLITKRLPFISKSHPRATLRYRGTDAQCTMTSSACFYFLWSASCSRHASVWVWTRAADCYDLTCLSAWLL